MDPPSFQFLSALTMFASEGFVVGSADVALPELVKADTWPNRLIVGHKTVDGQNLAQDSPRPDPT